ncbi:MAG TPA: protoporphyrinogen oxidase HemJ [Methylocystis sp.]|nr:protoporphyrinogen oxidase HemJ [Methylocystis sp.]
MYLWIKALHVIAIISWMAGLLYLPRLFVYHADAAPGPQSQTFKTMERKLLKIIMRPSAAFAWATGLYLAATAGYFHSGWFHGKLLLVVLLTAAHGYDELLVKRFGQDRNERSSRFFRFYNEVPTLLMIGIVILAIVKPF